MKKALVLILTACVGLLCLCACHTGGQIPPQELPPSLNNIQTPPPAAPETPAAPDPITMEHLTFELVVSWEESNRLVPELNGLSSLLREALLEQNCRVDEVTITISTAAGLTGDALENGGVDLALMSAEDYAACSNCVSAVLTSNEDPCSTVLAISGVKPDMSDAFRSALTGALTNTEAGSSFLNTYREGIVYIPATEEAIQTLRDYFAAQGAQNQGGN